ncbi:hypothetical protein LZ32DRAFT_619093 [Colletotrichum eremochloae]|nr:hypothetical protein LZ32DRAFT_619093 [Colletotrichum eremochloae]
MSSSLARTRSLRKPTQGSSTDLPPTGTAPKAAAPSSDATASTTTTSAHRPGSPSRLPAPRSLAAPRPTTRSVSGASVASVASVASTTGNTDAAAAKKKKSNPISTLLRRNAPTAPTRQRDAPAAAAAGGPVGSGAPSAPSSRTSALAGLTRTSSTREPGLTRTRYPLNASTSNLGQYSSTTVTTTTTTAATSPRTRSSTTVRPTTSGGLTTSRPTSSAASSTASSPTKGHARAKSVATLNGSTILRPPGQSSAGPAPARARPTSLYGAPPTSSTTATTTATARPRPPSASDRLSSKPSISSLSSTTTTATTTSTRPTRAASTSVAPKAPAKPAHQPPQPARQQRASPTSPPRHHPPRGVAAAVPTTASLRPAFNTLQQHYSPAKSLAPKPLTATYLAPPSPSKLPANVALTAETARLQAELLQLHLLHRDLPQTTAAWHASARAALAARHADLAKSSADLARLEADAAERLNVAALRRWGQSSSRSHSSGPHAPGAGATTTTATLEDKIQRLDALLTSLWSLDTPGGKYGRLVRAFERWASALPDLEAARARAEDAGDPSALLDADSQVRYVGGLDARWKDEAAALVRKLEGWDAQLREMAYAEEEAEVEEEEEEAVVGRGGGGGGGGKTHETSSLKRMLDGCGSLVRDMLQELAVMEEIEAAAVERETEWIRRMNREGDDGRGREDTQRAGAVWRLV